MKNLLFFIQQIYVNVRMQDVLTAWRIYMKLLKFLCGRVVITAVLLLVQVIWWITLFMRLAKYSAMISIIFTILSVLITLFIISKDDNPAYKIAWIVLISLSPLLGGLFYLAFGNKRPSKNMRHTLEAERKKSKQVLKQKEQILEEVKQLDERLAGQVNYIAKSGGYPMQSNTTVTYFSIGEDMFASMIEELEKAEHFIFMEYFIIKEGYMWNRILEILKRKVKQGVDVRLIYDDMGSLFLLPNGYDKKMEQFGIHCFAFNPFVPVLSLAMNNRDHRKILVIDGHTGFNGGINLSDEYINRESRFGHWKDTGVMLKGDGVWNFTVMFLEMWNAFRKNNDSYEMFRPHKYHVQAFEKDGYVQAFSDSPLDNETVSENVYIEILSQAKQYVYIFTPYLVITNEMQAALCMAAKRGVDVRLITPGIPDKKLVFQLTRSYYPSLIRAGVKIYEYTPGFVHAKCFVSDDEKAIVGTINMDYRSLYLHFECGTFLYRSKAILNVKKDILDSIQKSREVQLEDCRLGFFGSLMTAILRVVSPLL